MTEEIQPLKKIAAKYCEEEQTVLFALAANNATPVMVVTKNKRENRYTEESVVDALVHLYQIRQQAAEETAKMWKRAQKTIRSQYEKEKRGKA